MGERYRYRAARAPLPGRPVYVMRPVYGRPAPLPRGAIGYPPHNEKTDRNLEWVAMRDLGVSYTAIGREYGVSRQCVAQTIKRVRATMEATK